MFYSKQQMYLGNKSQLLKIFDPTSYLMSTLKKDALILDLSEIVNSQAVATAKPFSKCSDGIIKFVHNLSLGYSHIDIVCDSYFDNSLKLHTLETRGCRQFFPFTEAANMPKDFPSNFLRHKRNRVTLNLIPVVKLLTHDFVGAFVLISMNSKVKCNSTDVSEEDIYLAYQRVLGGMYESYIVHTYQST